MKLTFLKAHPANRRLLAPGPPGLAALRGGCPAGPGWRATLEELIVWERGRHGKISYH